MSRGWQKNGYTNQVRRTPVMLINHAEHRLQSGTGPSRTHYGLMLQQPSLPGLTHFQTTVKPRKVPSATNYQNANQRWSRWTDRRTNYVHFLIHLLCTKLHASVVAAWLFLVKNCLYFESCYSHKPARSFPATPP